MKKIISAFLLSTFLAAIILPTFLSSDASAWSGTKPSYCGKSKKQGRSC
jgi:hypothetical protein